MTDLQFEILGKPDYGFLKLRLAAGQSLCVEASAMAAMDTNLVMKTRMKGGLMASLKRGLAGESLFMNEFTAEGGPGEICIAPGAIGDLAHYRIQPGKSIYLQSGAYVASSPEVKVDTKWDGFRGFFSGTGLFLLKVEGNGDLFFNAYGGLVEIPVQGNYVIDTGYIAAFEDSLNYEVTLLGGLKTSLLGGEGLVCRFSGQGKIWLQTRQIYPFLRWLWPFRPQKNND